MPGPQLLAVRQVEIWRNPGHHGRWLIRRWEPDGDNDKVGEFTAEVVSAHVTWLDHGDRWSLEKLEVVVRDPFGGADRHITGSLSPSPSLPAQTPPLWVIETVHARLAELNDDQG